jgi:hypothetical protein
MTGRLDFQRNHPPVAEALRGAEPQEDACQAPASAALAYEPRFPARVHVGRQRQQVCLERELLDHNQLVFEKKPSPSG